MLLLSLLYTTYFDWVATQKYNELTSSIPQNSIVVNTKSFVNTLKDYFKKLFLKKVYITGHTTIEMKPIRFNWDPLILSPRFGWKQFVFNRHFLYKSTWIHQTIYSEMYKFNLMKRGLADSIEEGYIDMKIACIFIGYTDF